MSLYSKLPPDFKKSTETRITEQWERLNKLVLHYTDRCIGYLFILNSGGALLIITHIGASGIAVVNAGHKASLKCFIAGIIFSIALNICLMHFSNKIQNDFNEDSGKFYDDKMEYDTLWTQVDERAKKADPFYTVGYLALVLWLAGVFFGWRAIFNG
jgi:hypothetical protein